MDSDHIFSQDIRRTILLSSYISAWGMPLTRRITTKEDFQVEVYFFPAKQDGLINRYATVGVSGKGSGANKSHNWELFMAVPSDNAGATQAEIENFMFDVMCFSLQDNVQFELGATFPETPLMPASWPARALLIDEPRAEPEFIESISVGEETVNLLWIVPIYKSEHDLIVNSGLADFDAATEKSEWSLAYPLRYPYA